MKPWLLLFLLFFSFAVPAVAQFDGSVPAVSVLDNDVVHSDINVSVDIEDIYYIMSPTYSEDTFIFVYYKPARLKYPIPKALGVKYSGHYGRYFKLHYC